MQRRVRILFALILLSVVGVAADRDPQVLMQADRDFAKATAAKGVDGWLAYMASGAVLLGAKPVVGPDQIKTVMSSELAPGVSLTWEPTKAEFVGNTGDLGYTIGRFERRSAANGKTSLQKGTYMTTWQKQKDGSWKVISDIGEPDKAR